MGKFVKSRKEERDASLSGTGLAVKTGDDDKTAPPHTLDEAELLERYHTSVHGLSKREAADLLARLGANELREAQTRPAWRILVDQFKDFLVIVLIIAAVVSGFVGEVGDAVAIVCILLMNGLLGFIQEYRAEKAMSALCKMSPPKAHVVRDGRDMIVPAANLVPGDMVVLEAGTVVPADMRIIESANLRINESALTGESVPVEKTFTPLDDVDLPLADRSNVGYMGTIVTYGRGVGLVFATGMHTELGRIAQMLESQEREQTPLQKRLDALGRHLTIIALVICLVLFVVGIARGEKTLNMLMTAISLAVAAIPEALPAVVTISLALGAARMVASKALVRKLPAVETLGSVTVICSDKTGTLTQNRMLVRQVWLKDKSYAVSGHGYEPKGQFTDEAGDSVDPLACEGGDLSIVLRCLTLCNDSSLIPPMGDLKEWDVTGDPTEGGLVTLAAKGGLYRRELKEQFPRRGELPFDSERKMMTTLHQATADSSWVSYTKGGLDVVLPLCTKIRWGDGGSDVGLDDEKKELVLKASEEMAADGLRVLVAAQREYGPDKPVVDNQTMESDLTLLGFVGIQDPPRETVAASVATCRAAGIHPIMITGDHPLTAAAIAAEIGMVDGTPEVLTGRQLTELSVDELKEKVDTVQVFARVSPEHKLKIIEALRSRGDIVAMTGDGVNDAPALKEADIGVAMGIQGTDVSKEAADMILLDDNFSTIVHAVKDGRRIFENIRKFVRFVVIGNTGEIWTMFLAPFFGLPIPLVPIQILWVNLVTDGLPGLALAVEPAEGDVMKRKPRPVNEGILMGSMGLSIFFSGLYIGLLCLAAQWYVLSGSAGGPADVARSRAVVFTLLCALQLFLSLSVKSERDYSLKTLLSSPWLIASFLLCGFAQLVVVSFPAVAAFFKVAPLSWSDLAVIGLAGSSIFFLGELGKFFRRTRNAVSA